MATLFSVITIVIGIVCSVGLCSYFKYKEKELECQEVYAKQNEEISIKALQLELEKENTKQMELDSNAFRAKHDVVKAQEETEQLKIKADYREKHGERLY